MASRRPGPARRARTSAGAGLVEEHAVALVADDRIDNPRGVGSFGHELEPAWIHRRPADRRSRLQEIAFELLILVSNVRAVEDAAPFDVEGDLRNLRKASGEDLRERALQIVIVEDPRREAEARLPGAEVYLDAFAWHGYRPEDAVRIDVRVVVVNLVRSNWTVEDVESDEPERRVVMLAVDGQVLAYTMAAPVATTRAQTTNRRRTCCS